MPTTKTATSATRAATERPGQSSVVAPGLSDSGAIRRPVPFGRPVDVTDTRDRPAVPADRVGHLALAVEQPLELALVQADAHDLALELVGDVGVAREDANVGWQAGQRVGSEVGEAVEVVPERVREVL